MRPHNFCLPVRENRAARLFNMCWFSAPTPPERSRALTSTGSGRVPCAIPLPLQVLKRETHRQALVDAVTSSAVGHKFFLGTDSAPHPKGAKEVRHAMRDVDAPGTSTAIAQRLRTCTLTMVARARLRTRSRRAAVRGAFPRTPRFHCTRTRSRTRERSTSLRASPRSMARASTALSPTKTL